MTEGAVRAESPRLVAPGEVDRRGIAVAFEAGPRERAALAQRLELLALERLTATLRLDPAAEVDGGIRVSGTIEARAVQRCVATLEPVPQAIRETIAVLYAPLPADQAEREVEVPPDGEAPEPLPEAGIDVGALAAEHLALLLDPYPRHPDAPPGPLEYATGEAAGKTPFAALGQLKSKL